MLIVYTQNKELLGPLYECEDLCIEKKLDMDDATLSFTTSFEYAKGMLKIEGYIQHDQEYVIKEINKDSSGKVSVVAQKNYEHFENHYYAAGISYTNQTVYQMVDNFVTGAGWTVDSYSDDTKKDLQVTEPTNAVDLLKRVSALFRVNYKIDTLNKKVTINGYTGNRTNAIVSDELNLKNITVQSSSYDTYTKLVAYGKDGLTFADINDGKNYIENHNALAKEKVFIWNASDYTSKVILLGDAVRKLKSMCKPYVSYDIDLIDIGRMNPNYQIHKIDLGDKVLISDSITGTNTAQIVVGCKIYPDSPEKNSYTFANKMLTFIDAVSTATKSQIKDFGDYSIFDSTGD